MSYLSSSPLVFVDFLSIFPFVEAYDFNIQPCQDFSRMPTFQDRSTKVYVIGGDAIDIVYLDLSKASVKIHSDEFL